MSMTSASYQAYYPPGTWRGVNPNIPTRMSAPAVASPLGREAPALPPHFLNGNSQRIQSSPPFDKQAAASVGFNGPAGVGDVRSLRYMSTNMDAMLLDGADGGKQNPGIQQTGAPTPWGKKVAKRTSMDIEKEINAQNLYKTELCRSFVETGACRYGAKCQFAHGKAELRPVLRHPKYKTEICKTFHTIGTCPYGTRCRFIHQRSEVEIPDNSIFVSPPQTGVVAPEWSIWKDIVLSETPAQKTDPISSPTPTPAPATVPYARRSTTIVTELSGHKQHKVEKRNSQPIRSGRQRANTLSPPSGRKKQQQHNDVGAKPPLKLGAARSNNLSDNGFIGLRHHRRKEDAPLASVLEGLSIEYDDDDVDDDDLIEPLSPVVASRSPGLAVDFDSDDDDNEDEEAHIHHQIDSNANNVGSDDDTEEEEEEEEEVHGDDDDDEADSDDQAEADDNDSGDVNSDVEAREVKTKESEDEDAKVVVVAAPTTTEKAATAPESSAEQAPSSPKPATTTAIVAPTPMSVEDKRRASVFSSPPVATAAQHRARSNSGGNSRLPIFQVLSTASPEDDAAAAASKRSASSS